MSLKRPREAYCIRKSTATYRTKTATVYSHALRAPATDCGPSVDTTVGTTRYVC